jgi:hypothetical protein
VLKRIIAAAFSLLLVTVLTVSSIGAAGGASDPLASLSYLDTTLKPALIKDAQEQIKKSFDGIYDALAAKLDGTSASGGYDFAGGNTGLVLAPGKSVELTFGSSFVLTSGSAALTVSRGEVIDLASGAPAVNGQALVANRRYFLAEDTSAVVRASSDVRGFVNGFYKTDGVPVREHAVFKDVRTTDWFYNAVDYVYTNALFSGSSASTFSPSTPMTRAMFVTVLHRLAGKPAPSGDVRFTDVADTTQYYYDAVRWAAASAVVTGYDDGTFRPDAPVTREQMAAIMYRYAAYKGQNTAGAPETALDKFPDKGEVSDYAVPSMAWAVNRALINGSDGKLLPRGTATRAQVAQIVLNFASVGG